MDLDNIKDTWRNAEVKEPSIDEQQIQHILNKRGLTAIEKLIKYEKWGLYAIVLSLFLFPIIIQSNNNLVMTIVFGVSCLIAFVWQFRKYELLASIDVKTMDLLTVSTKFVKYNKMMNKELIIGSLWLIAFLASFFLVDLYFDPRKKAVLVAGDISVVLFLVIIPILLALLVSLFFYHKIYYKNIKRVKQSIEELESIYQDENN